MDENNATDKKEEPTVEIVSLWTKPYRTFGLIGDTQPLTKLEEFLLSLCVILIRVALFASIWLTLCFVLGEQKGNV